jgi:hypothetical protein
MLEGQGEERGWGERLKSQPYTNYKGFERLLTISLEGNNKFIHVLW